MTVRIIDHANFVLAEHLPKLDPSISVAQAYKTLSTAGRGAFTFSEGQRDYFVKADELILSLFQGRDEGEIRELMRRTLSEALHRADPDTILPITESIEDQRDIRTLQTHLPEVFAVMRGTRKLGFLLNNPVLLSPATKRIWYICANSHRNPDPDTGTCYKCPAKIVRTETK